jgi:hypothetical protein
MSKTNDKINDLSGNEPNGNELSDEDLAQVHGGFLGGLVRKVKKAVKLTVDAVEQIVD